MISPFSIYPRNIQGPDKGNRHSFPIEMMYACQNHRMLEYSKKPMPSLHIEHLQGFITEVVDDFDGDFACRWSRERSAFGAVKGRPGRLINPARSARLGLS
jgi:hypothetical protein